MQVKHTTFDWVVPTLVAFSFFTLFILGTMSCDIGAQDVAEEVDLESQDGYFLIKYFRSGGYLFHEWCVYGVKYLGRHDFFMRLSDINGDPLPCEEEKK
jgi:hypothetical protein